MERTRTVLAAAGVLALAASLGGCGAAKREGPRIDALPEGFVYDPDAGGARLVFPGRTVLRQQGYFTTTEPGCSIMLTTYAGTTTREEVEAACAGEARRYRNHRFGPVESLTIDGRPAWGWLESQVFRGTLASLEYSAAVSYDSVTYTVEFHAADPRYRGAALLRATVSSFEVYRSPRTPWPLVVMSIVAIGLFSVLGPRVRRVARPG